MSICFFPLMSFVGKNSSALERVSTPSIFIYVFIYFSAYVVLCTLQWNTSICFSFKIMSWPWTWKKSFKSIFRPWTSYRYMVSTERWVRSTWIHFTENWIRFEDIVFDHIFPPNTIYFWKAKLFGQTFFLKTLVWKTYFLFGKYNTNTSPYRQDNQLYT